MRTTQHCSTQHTGAGLLLSGLLFCSVALLSACGGGYGSDGVYQTPAAATVTIAVAPTTIIQGQSAVLTWTSNGTACTASGAWAGAQAPNGMLTVAPVTLGNNTYTLTCSGGPYSSNNASAVLAVTAASAFTKSNLVSASAAAPNTRTDPQIVNPWGIAFAPTGPIWTANKGSQTSTLYDGTGLVQALIVSVPAGVRGNANPTGIVFNGTAADFTVTSAGRSAGAVFIFTGENGTISGWSPTVAGTQALALHDNQDGAAFKGLAIANNGMANFLYATDFHNNKVLVFDRAMTKITVAGGFTDAMLPVGYAPFGIQTLQLQGQTRIVVTYAKQDALAHDEVAGAGFGLVNVFDTAGTLIARLVPVGGALNAPWGLALAPDNFGTLSGKLLVGNFGSGVINAYDPISGQFFGTVNDASGAAITTSGLRGIAFGNGARNQPRTTLYFFAGIDAQAGGLYGRIDLGATAPDIVAPTVSIASPAAATVAGVVPIAVNAADNVGVAQVQFFAGGVSIGTAATAPFTFNWNSASVGNAVTGLTAQARDAAGNVTTSAAVAVTVNN